MIFKIKVFDDSLVKTINSFYEFCEFRDGKATGSPHKDFKNNLELYDTVHKPVLDDMVLECLKQNDVLIHKHLVHKFTTPVFLKYAPGMHYIKHNDFYIQNNFVRTDYSMSIFLSNPSSYEGGELEILVGSETMAFKEEPGWAIFYPTGLGHSVKPVISGERRVCVMWMESVVSSSVIRNSCAELYQMLIDSKHDPEKCYLTKDQIYCIENVRFNLIREYGNFNVSG